MLYHTHLICPVCGGELNDSGKSYVCGKNHCFDISSKGYVNLLLSGSMKSKMPGDNKLMVQARRDFLDRGYYRVLADALCDTVTRYFPQGGGVLLDAGCGEGYYTAAAAGKLAEKNIPADIIAADISKTACRYAANRLRGFTDMTGTVAVTASIFRIPLADGSTDMLLSVFAPFCREEFHRVLKSGGTMIMVIPSAKHLWELKAAVYDEPYPNEQGDTYIEGFSLAESISVDEDIFLASDKDIMDLFSMTPYFYKTGREGHERLERLSSLKTHIGFTLLVYRRS